MLRLQLRQAHVLLNQSRLLTLQALLQLGVVLFQAADPLLRQRAFFAALRGRRFLVMVELRAYLRQLAVQGGDFLAPVGQALRQARVVAVQGGQGDGAKMMFFLQLCQRVLRGAQFLGESGARLRQLQAFTFRLLQLVQRRIEFGAILLHARFQLLRHVALLLVIHAAHRFHQLGRQAGFRFHGARTLKFFLPAFQQGSDGALATRAAQRFTHAVDRGITPIGSDDLGCFHNIRVQNAGAGHETTYERNLVTYYMIRNIA